MTQLITSLRSPGGESLVNFYAEPLQNGQFKLVAHIFQKNIFGVFVKGDARDLGQQAIVNGGEISVAIRALCAQNQFNQLP